ncbi:MAG TPA: 50S ribosomal protein L11 [Candidatus Acidoferrales bacterium]|nr:50S ribosomal protein L11 [Candidatus Acidoferrales bacterium]
MSEIVQVLIPGGKATPGPPIGPSLGPLGINVKKVVDDMNAQTASYNGMMVPVTIIVDENKNVTLEVGTPPTSALILMEAGLEKGSSTGEVVGNLTILQAVKIAQMKREKSLSYELRNTVKEVLGTCVSMGISVDGKAPREVQRAIDEGDYDSQIEDQVV